MIVRRHNGQLDLFCQNDHAELASRFAEAFGAPGFLDVQPRPLAVQIISLHDRGWIPVDASPRIDPASNRPRDFLAMPSAESAAIWTESIRQTAEAAGPLGGLVVSRHFLRMALASLNAGHRTPEEQSHFQVFRSQQEPMQAEWLEELEAYPAGAGPETAAPVGSLLRACDMFSIFLLLCGENCGMRGEPFDLGEGAASVRFEFAWPSQGTMSVAPWPFAPRTLEFEVLCRSVDDRDFADDADLCQAFLASEPASLSFRVVPG